MKAIYSLLLFIMLAGCVGNPNLAQDDTYKDEWVVDQPIEVVFKEYKDYAEREFTGGDFLWSGGVRFKGYYYGSNAEIALQMEGNPLIEGPYLLVNLDKIDDSTQVTSRAYNGMWRERGQELKSLL